MKPVVLALDIGTSSTRSALVDARGRFLPGTLAQEAYPLRTDSDGRAELRPEVLADVAARMVASSLKIHRRGKSSGAPVSAIGVSCFWHGLMGVDARGKPLTPVYTWADSRCRDDARQLRRELDERKIHARTGCVLHATFWPAKLSWLRRVNPALFARVHRWISPGEWLQWQWCGGATASISMASATGLLNRHTLDWDAALLSHGEIESKKLSPISDAPGRLTPGMIKRFPDLREARFFPALGDGATSNLGSGAVAGGVAAINVGTSAALRIVVRTKSKTRLKLPKGLFLYRLDANRQIFGGAIGNAGNLRAWAERELKLPSDPREQERLLQGRFANPAQLNVLPFWVGERAPSWPDRTPSVVVGLSLATTAIDFLRALQEASYLRLAQIAERVEHALGKKLVYIVSGGICHSPNSLQLLSDVLGRKLFRSRDLEASLLGAGLFALERLGLRHPPPKLARPIQPHPARSAAYRLARERQVRLEHFASKLNLSPANRQAP